MPAKTRKQLTLFLQKEQSWSVEKIRQRFNPVQAGMIDAHVTLCRDNELTHIDTVLANLRSSYLPEIAIRFEKPARFEAGKGVWLPSTDTASYHTLRTNVLRGIVDSPAQKIPHITLMHPRNSACTNEIFERICEETFPTFFTFKEISLIGQPNGGKWEVLDRFELHSAKSLPG